MGTILLMGAGLQTTVTGPTYDPDAQLFFNAESSAGVTLTSTQMNAVNQWVVDAKAAGIWSKFKAIYPIVGGTVTSHKFNLKNPLDTNAAFRLTFFGGGTHSSNGYQPNGTNAYADTFLIPSTAFSNTNNHLSFYSRTSSNVGNLDMGAYWTNSPAIGNYTAAYFFGTGRVIDNNAIGYLSNNDPDRIQYTQTNASGMFLLSRTATNSLKMYQNNILKQTNTVVASSVFNTLPQNSIFIGASNYRDSGSVSVIQYGAKQCAFASIGDGLTDLESQLLYQITEKYQVALGRNINATQSFYYNSAYNNETNAFLFSTQITDNTIQTATNTLVTDLKTAGVFTKMKALYPMVGGTATTNKFNLVNAQDTDAAFRLSFIGGVTHSANGILGNGINGYANTFLNPSVIFTGGTSSIGIYSRTSAANTIPFIGNIIPGSATTSNFIRIAASTTNNIRHFNRGPNAAQTNHIVANTLGFNANSRTSNVLLTSISNTGSLLTNTSTVTAGYTNLTLPLLGDNNNGIVTGGSNAELAFAYIADSLTSAELTTLKSINQTFQTTLGRQV